MWRDVVYAVRQLRKSPGFTITAVLTLAFGIGATTAIFSIVEGVLLRPLPFADPARLMAVGDQIEGLGSGDDAIFATAPEVGEYARGTHAFAALGGFRYRGYELSGSSEPARIEAARLTASVFPLLGVAPIMGRTFTQKEDENGAQVTVLSYGTWRSRFHGDRHILGQKILLDRKPYEVIGVMPRDFEFPLTPGQLERIELWAPISFTADDMQGVSRWDCQMIGRLGPGVTPAQARQDMLPVAQAIKRAMPEGMNGISFQPAVRSLQETTVGRARPALRILLLAVLAMLAIACINLAGLLLVKVIQRRREIAVRLALGASGGAVVRQAVVEACVLSALGGLLGLTLADALLQLGIGYLPESLPRVSAIALDWNVALAGAGLALATGLVCGLIPGVAALRTGVNDELKTAGRTGTASSGQAHLRSALVITQIAAALILLVGAGLLVRSYEKLRQVDLGFMADHVLTASYSLPRQQYATQAAVDSFSNELLTKLKQLPRAGSSGVTTMLPSVGQTNNWNSFVPEGYESPRGEELTQAWAARVMGDFFPAAGVPLLRGRLFTSADGPNAPLVAIVNRTLAEHYWPGQDAIGKRLHMGLKDTRVPWLTVVGIVGDVKAVEGDVPTRNQIYQPAQQYAASQGSFADPSDVVNTFGTIVVRSPLPPERVADSVRGAVRTIDPQLPLTHVESMERVVQNGQAPRQFNAVLVSCFAATAALLALLGIYSVTAFSAAMRTQEMAIRLAMGAHRWTMMRMVIASGVWLGIAGGAVGIVASLFVTRILRSLLFQVDPLDPWVLGTAAGLLVALAAAASVGPAVRAAWIEPVQALRSE